MDRPLEEAVKIKVYIIFREVISFIRSTDRVGGRREAEKGTCFEAHKTMQMSHTTSECLF